MLAKRLELGAEQKDVASPSVVQRLLAQAITDEMEPVVPSIEECEGKHPSEMLSSLDYTIPLDYRKHYFGVRLAAEANALRLQLRSQFKKVVNLAVEDDDVAT